MSPGMLIVRLDDVRELSPRLAAVWDVLEANRVPVHLEVIPFGLETRAVDDLLRRARHCRVEVAVHQHGYRHANHGTDSRRFEFDDSRSFETQFAEIAEGRRILEQAFGGLFEAIFSLPWNRCGQTTLDALSSAGFDAVSMVAGPDAPAHSALTMLPVTVDPVRWRPRPIHLPWDQTLAVVEAQLADAGYAGLCLHHELMVDEACAGLTGLLESLAGQGVRFPVMGPAVAGVQPR